MRRRLAPCLKSKSAREGSLSHGVARPPVVASKRLRVIMA